MTDANTINKKKPQNKPNTKNKLALLVGVSVTGHDGADGRESDAGHGCYGSGSPHHPTTSNTHQLRTQTILLQSNLQAGSYFSLRPLLLAVTTVQSSV